MRKDHLGHTADAFAVILDEGVRDSPLHNAGVRFTLASVKDWAIRKTVSAQDSPVDFHVVR
jgi:hypothetical protein